MRLKPFLTISKLDKREMTLGLTDRYRVNIPNYFKLDLLDKNSIVGKRLNSLGLLNEDEGEYIEPDSRTISYLSLYTNKPVNLLNEFRNLTVIIAGCGGLGSRIALELASLKIKKLILVDPDTIEDSNLQRMFWSNENDIGKYKVNLIKELIYGISPNTEVESHCTCSKLYLEQGNYKADFVFITADNEDGAIQQHIGDRIKEKNIPHMVSGYWESILVAGPIIDSNCHYSLKDIYSSSNKFYRDRIVRDFIPPSIGFTNSIITGVVINEFIKYIAGYESSLINKQWQLDILTMKSKFIKVIL